MNARFTAARLGGAPISRRGLIVSAGAAGLAAAARPYGAFAAGPESTLKVGFVSPRTGKLAGFGETDGYVLELARKALASGLKAGDKTYGVEILDRDSQSDPARAGQLAKTLINSDKIDMMLAISTPEVINPVADACEAAGVPCMSTVMPWEAWYYGRGAKPGQPAPFKWTFHFSFGGAEFAGTYVAEWGLIPTNKKVGVMYPNDADGNAVRGFLPDAFKKAGFIVVDPGPFEDGTSDYSAQIEVFKKEQCEIINALVLPPDFATFWRQAAQQGITKIVKIAQPAKACGSVTEITALGQLGYNLCVCSPWNPAFPYKSPVTGMNSRELTDGYEKASGRQANQQMGATMSELDAGFAALQATTNPLDKPALAKTISTLKTITTIGPVDFNVGPMPHVIATTKFVGTQYQKAKPGSKWKVEQVVIENSELPDVPLGSKVIPYNTGA